MYVYTNTGCLVIMKAEKEAQQRSHKTRLTALLAPNMAQTLTLVDV